VVVYVLLLAAAAAATASHSAVMTVSAAAATTAAAASAPAGQGVGGVCSCQGTAGRGLQQGHVRAQVGTQQRP
jgi:hypothetical protein